MKKVMFIPANEYSGANYTSCPVIGNRNSGLLETVILGGPDLYVAFIPRSS